MAGPLDEMAAAQARLTSPRVGRLTETKPFFLTSEFLGVLAALAALAVTAASSDTLDAALVWPLATAIVAAYVFSRGFSKGHSVSRSWDPRETPQAWWGIGGDGASSGARGEGATTEDNDETAGADGRTEEGVQRMSSMTRDEYDTQVRAPMVGPYGYGRGYGLRQAYPVETKPFFITSEFWGSIALIIALAIAAGTAEDIDARLFWILASAITVGYVISRGIAKSGTKSRSWDPRDELMQGVRARVTDEGR
jgi:hypothetical protein